MKDYLWIFIAGIIATIAFVFFLLTIAKSTSLIKKAKKSKGHILVNLLVLTIGIGNIGIIMYLLKDIRQQIEMFTMF